MEREPATKMEAAVALCAGTRSPIGVAPMTTERIQRCVDMR